MHYQVKVITSCYRRDLFSLTTILAEDDSGMNEDIIVESPNISKIEYDHHDAINSSTTLESTTCNVDSCDNLTYLPSDNVNDFVKIDQFPFSYDEHIICVNFINRKCHFHVQFCKHALHGTRIAIIMRMILSKGACLV